MSGIDDCWRAFGAEPTAERFAEFYEASRGLVWSICWRTLRSEEDALDAYQSTYARLLSDARAGRTFAETAELQVLKTAVSEAKNFAKRRARRGRKEIAVEALPSVAAVTVTAEQKAAEQELAEQLALLVSLLPEVYRMPLLLHFYHQKSQVEIAAILGNSRQAIARRIDKGLRLLEPKARQAGLAEVLRAVAVTGGAALLLQPPGSAAFAAEAVFVHAGVATGAGATAWAGTLAAKWAAGTAAGLLAVGGVIFAVSDREPTRPTTATASSIVARSATGMNSGADATAAVGADGLSSTTAVSTIDPDDFMVASTPTPVPVVSPVPMPTGPTRRVALQVVWDKEGAPVPGTAVTMSLRGGGAADYRGTGVTNANGLVEIEMPEGYRQIVARGDHPAAPIWSTMIEIAAEQPPILRLPREARIFGRAIDGRTGGPAAGAQIWLTKGRYSWPDPDPIVADADGTFVARRLAAGNYFLLALRGNLRSDMTSVSPIEVAEGTELGPVDLRMVHAAIVEGRVTEQGTGRPLADIEISYGQSGRIKAVWEKAMTGRDGRFRLKGLPGGKFSLSARGQGHVWEERVISPNLEEPVTCDFVMKPAGTVLTTVVDSAGLPVPGAEVRIHGRSDLYERARTVTDSAGRALIGPVDPQSPPEIGASRAGYLGDALRPEPFAPGTQGGARLVLKPNAPITVAGKVIDPDGKPLKGVRVSYAFFMIKEGKVLGGLPTIDAYSDAGGNYRFTIQDPKETPVLAIAENWALQLTPPIELSETTKTVTIDFRMKKPRSIEGVVVDESGVPLGGINVYARPKPARPVHIAATTNAQGRFTLDKLAQETIDLAVESEGWVGQSVEVAPDTDTVRLALVRKKGGMVAGRVVDAKTRRALRQFTIRLSRVGSGDWSMLDYDTRLALGSGGETFETPDGNFAVDGLVADQRYTFIVEAKGYSAHVLREVSARVAGDATPVDVRLEPGQALQGVLVDAATGEPIGDAKLYALIGDVAHVNWNQLGKGLFGNGYEVVAITESEKNGRFSLPVARENFALAIEPGIHERRLIRSDALVGAGRGMVIGLHRAAVVEIEPPVGGEAGLLRAQVNGRLDEGISWAMSTVAPSTGSRVVIGGLPAGKSYLTIGFADARHAAMFPAQSRTIALAEGERRVLRTGEGSGSLLLYGLVVDDAGQPVPRASITFNGSLTTECNERGIYAIEGLRPGRYRVMLQSRNGDDYRYAWHDVQINGGQQDFNIGGPPHEVKVRLAYNSSEQLEWHDRTIDLALMATDRDTAARPDGTYHDQSGYYKPKGDMVRIAGRFRGKYQLHLRAKGLSGQTVELTIPDILILDTLENDQDIGEVRIPPLAELRRAH